VHSKRAKMVFCLMARWTFVDFDLDAIVFSPEKYTQNLWEKFPFLYSYDYAPPRTHP